MTSVLVAVALVVAIGLGASMWSLSRPAPQAPPSASTNTPTSAGPGRGAPPGTSEVPNRATPTAVGAPSPGPVIGATATAGSEVPALEPTASPVGRIPGIPARAPLVTAPPPPGYATGELVAGFPAEVMGPAPQSDVVSSQITGEEGTSQVTLVARTDAPADTVRAHYRTAWANLGLSDVGPGTGADIAYRDAHTSVSLAFAPGTGTGTVYQLHAVFRAG